MTTLSSQLDAAFVQESLLGANFFPNQRSDPNELPASINSKSLTPSVSSKLIGFAEAGQRKKMGFDSVSYYSTRFDGRRRHLQIPHPAGYSDLVATIHSNWHEIADISTNPHSMIKPTAHADGRLFQMSYHDWVDRTRDELELIKGHSYQVSADIAQCFPSVYSHAIPWAAVGHERAKRDRDANLWFNRLDRYSRNVKCNETNGVIIGPGTSSILVEVVLNKVDRQLEQDGFPFRRYIDDYTAYVTSHEMADSFVDRLERELSRYHLVTNKSKATLEKLPGGRVEWAIAALRNALPTSEIVTRYQAMSFLDFAVGIAKAHPSISAVKYGLKSLLEQNIEVDAYRDVFLYAMTLAEKQSGLVSLLERFPQGHRSELIKRHQEDLERAISRFASKRQSDGMVWACSLLFAEGCILEDSTVDAIIASEDCLALCTVVAHGTTEQQKKVRTYLNSGAGDLPYRLDRHWLLWYEAFRRGLAKNPYTGKEADVFQSLADEGVAFVF